MLNLQTKRIAILTIYLVLFILIAGGLYSLFRTKENCVDGKQNQNEEGVDCGGMCPIKCEVEIVYKELVVGELGAVPSGIAGKYDFYAIVTNPNEFYGSKLFNYEINFKDSSGEIIASKNGSSFILPGEKKYVVESNIDSLVEPASYDFKIIDSNWIAFDNFYENPDLQIVNKKYSEILGGVGFSEVGGLLKNKSYFDFDTITIRIVLKDSNGKILAINSTQMKTVIAGGNRDFLVSWPNRFPGTVESVETQIEVDVFKADAFFKKFYRSQSFQKF